METVLISLLSLGVVVAFAINRYERQSSKKIIALLEMRNVSLELDLVEKRQFIARAFEAHPNLDLDVAGVTPDKAHA